MDACFRATGNVLPGPHTCTRRVGSDVPTFSKKPPRHVGVHTRDALRAIGATILSSDEGVEIKDLRAATKPTQQQVWWWRTHAPKYTNVGGYYAGVVIGSRTAGRDALPKDCVPAYQAGVHVDLLCGPSGEDYLRQEEAVMCLHGTSWFSFYAEGWQHVKLEAGEAFVASRLWFAKFFHFASSSEETIRMIVRNGSG
ncbi:SBP-type domain-containing protein [Pycnococcus provasolii]